MEFLSVGYERMRDLILEKSVQLGEENRTVPLLVRGEWGTGKSHLAEYVRAMAADLGVATAIVDLNARGQALNYPQRFYPALIESCRLDRSVSGLQQIISQRLSTVDGRRALLEYASTCEGELAQSIEWLCREHGPEDGLALSEHPAWTKLLGGDIAWAPYAYKRHRTLRRIGELVELLRALGGRGLILVLDEVETIDQLWNRRSRMTAYSTLGALCSMDHVWCVLAVTARFDAIVAADFAWSLISRSGHTSEAAWFLGALKRGEFQSVVPPTIDIEGAQDLAERLRRLYENAYGLSSSSVDTLAATIGAWSRDPRRNARTLIRAVVNELDLRRPLPKCPPPHAGVR